MTPTTAADATPPVANWRETDTGDAVPPEVQDTAGRIWSAAAAGDLKGMSEVASEDDFEFSFGGLDLAPLEFWECSLARGDDWSATTVELLRGPPESWFGSSYRWADDDENFGPRLIIEGDGQWTPLIAGD